MMNCARVWGGGAHGHGSWGVEWGLMGVCWRDGAYSLAVSVGQTSRPCAHRRGLDACPAPACSAARAAVRMPPYLLGVRFVCQAVAQVREVHADQAGGHTDQRSHHTLRAFDHHATCAGGGDGSCVRVGGWASGADDPCLMAHTCRASATFPRVLPPLRILDHPLPQTQSSVATRRGPHIPNTRTFSLQNPHRQRAP